MTTTRYLRINAIQEPFDMGLDDQGRSTFGFNIHVEKEQSDTFAREIISVLVAAGVGVFGTSLFTSTVAAIPLTGTIVDVIETSGLAPQRIHNDVMPKYAKPTAKIIAHAVKAEDAIAKIRAAYKALVVVRNQAVTVA